VLVVFIIAVVAVLAGVFFAATGRGGEMAYEPADHAPLDLGPVSATDIALLRPPTALWGYNTQVTDEALDRIARAMRDRDVTIAHLQQQLAYLDLREPGVPAASSARGAPEIRQARSARVLSDPEATLSFPKPLSIPKPPSPPKPPGILVASRAPETAQPPEPSVVTPHDATQPAQAVSAPDDTQGPQGPFDTHDWWAEQEEAAREEARRQAEAQKASEPPAPEPSSPEPSTTQARTVEPSAVEPSAVEPSAVEPSADETSTIEAKTVETSTVEPSSDDEAAGEYREPPTEPGGVRFGRTDTQPNPTLPSPSATATPAHPAPPDNDALAAAEEQAW
jgi:hypothetical protein